MVKKLYIFGNGLGRAFDNEFYSLERALRNSWGDSGPLTDEQRLLVSSCLETGVIEEDLTAPTTESQLRDLQRVIDACDLLGSFQELVEGPNGWLTTEGQNFPKAVRRYFHHAAAQFHDAAKVLPDDFARRFRDFVRKEGPHIATLNYDDLLYDAYVGWDISDDHLLRDGFFAGEFKIEQHKQYIDIRKEGWFLHLHGSPLFVTRGGRETKLLRAQLDTHRGDEQTHLVLTHARSKPGAIRTSTILREYWRILDEILKGSVEITVFGCSGEDEHLNQILRNTSDEVSIRIVNRTPVSEEAERIEWKKRLKGKDIADGDVEFYDDLMEFDNW